MGKIKELAVSLGFLLIVGVVVPLGLARIIACSPSANREAIAVGVKDVTPLGSCIIADAGSGIVDPAAIASDCAGATAQVIFSVVSDVLEHLTKRAGQIDPFHANMLKARDLASAAMRDP